MVVATQSGGGAYGPIPVGGNVPARFAVHLRIARSSTVYLGTAYVCMYVCMYVVNLTSRFGMYQTQSTFDY